MKWGEKMSNPDLATLVAMACAALQADDSHWRGMLRGDWMAARYSPPEESQAIRHSADAMMPYLTNEQLTRPFLNPSERNDMEQQTEDRSPNRMIPHPWPEGSRYEVLGLDRTYALSTDILNRGFEMAMEQRSMLQVSRFFGQTITDPEFRAMYEREVGRAYDNWQRGQRRVPDVDFSISVDPSDFFGEIFGGPQPGELPKEDKPDVILHPEMDYIQVVLTGMGRRYSHVLGQKLKGIVDRKEINKILFSHDFSTETSPAIAKDSIIAVISLAQEERIKVEHKKRIRALNESIANRAHSFLEYTNNATREASYMRKIQDELATMGEPGTVSAKLKESIEKMLSNPFIHAATMVNASVEMETGFVILRHVNQAQNVDMTVNFGSFKIIWYPHSNQFKVHRNKGNTVVHEYYHPHIGNSGDICLGNAAQAFTTALKDMEYHKCVEIIQTILHTYNPDSPFRRLDDFWTIQNKEKIKGMPFTYKNVGTVWIQEDEVEFSPRVLEHSENEDTGAEEVLINVYRRVNERYGVEFDDANVIFGMSGNNRYFEIDETDLNNEVNYN